MKDQFENLLYKSKDDLERSWSGSRESFDRIESALRRDYFSLDILFKGFVSFSTTLLIVILVFNFSHKGESVQFTYDDYYSIHMEIGEDLAVDEQSTYIDEDYYF